MVLAYNYISDCKINTLKEDKLRILDKKKKLLEDLNKYCKSVYIFTTTFNAQYGDKFHIRLFAIDKDEVMRNFPNTNAIEVETYDE